MDVCALDMCIYCYPASFTISPTICFTSTFIIYHLALVIYLCFYLLVLVVMIMMMMVAFQGNCSGVWFFLAAVLGSISGQQPKEKQETKK
jgi:hypothetical protein